MPSNPEETALSADSGVGAGMPRGLHVLFVAGVLAFAFAARAILVMRGGQYFFYDEAKFTTASEAAKLLEKGNVIGALAYSIEPHENVYADHIGYKIFGIVPELIEDRFGRNPHVPAYYFSAFSTLNVLLLAAIALRLTGSLRAFDLTLVASALSATLLIYARFIIPYDLSLCFALLAVWTGVKRPSGYARSVLVGALSCWAFFCYYGHWQLAGAAVLLHALWLADGFFTLIGRLVSAGIGYGLVVGILAAISHLDHHSLFRDMLEITKAQAAGENDFRSTLNSWLYFLYAERAALLLWIAAFLGGLWIESHVPRREGRLLTPLRLMAVGFVVVYGIFALDSDIRHHLVVHGRHSRQLLPFLLVGFGVGLDILCSACAWRGRTAALALALLAVNACFTFSGPLAMVFPRDFDARAEAVLAGLPPLTDGKSYYRKVNVDNYTYEPETLRSAPMETLLASPHPLQYPPYLYEGESQALKKLRVSVDHRMRLVRMAVPEAEQVHGDAYGIVRLKLAFPSTRSGFSEPLLSIGPRHEGDLFFVYYVTPATAELGFMRVGIGLVYSAPFDLEPGRVRVVALFSGALMPSPDQTMKDMNPAEEAYLRQSIYATIDGRVLLDQPMRLYAAKPGAVLAGVNGIESESAGAQFSGTISDVARAGWPPAMVGISKDQQFGAMHLRVAAPPVSNNSAEPLFVVGIPGRAVLAYMRISPEGLTTFGVEIWGIGSYESPPQHVDLSKPLECEYSFGSLYPPSGHPAWNGLPVEQQMALERTLRITVNGNSVLDITRETPGLASLPVYVGSNPVGGSLVNAGFSGKVLLSYRAPFGK